MATSALIIVCLTVSLGAFAGAAVIEGDVFHHSSSDDQKTNAAVIQGDAFHHSSDDQKTRVKTESKVGDVHYYSTDLQSSLDALSDRVYGQAKSVNAWLKSSITPDLKDVSSPSCKQNSDFTNDFFNDRVESIKAAGKCRWLFYEHTNFLGRTHILSAGYYSSAPSWGGQGNQISSARALPKEGSVAIALFQHINYQGRMLVLTASSRHLPSLDFNDAVSSIIVLGGQWILYEHDQFQGRHSTLKRGEYPNIHYSHIGGDSVSSVLRRSGLALLEEFD